MPGRRTAAHYPAPDNLLPPELVRFREERPQRQAALATWLREKRQAALEMPLRLVESYLEGAGTPLSRNPLGQMESPTHMAEANFINLPIILALALIYNGDLNEVVQILIGPRRARESALEAEIAARQRDEAGIIAAYRALPPQMRPIVRALMHTLLEQQDEQISAYAEGDASMTAPERSGNLLRAVNEDAPSLGESAAIVQQRLLEQRHQVADQTGRKRRRTEKRVSDGPNTH